VQHKIAHVKQDGWHYLNMEVKITSMLKTPVTGVLGATYHPETYWHNLQEAKESSHHGVVDHSSSSRALKDTMPHGLLIHPADDDEGITSTLLRRRKLLLDDCWCNGVKFSNSRNICCDGVINPRFARGTGCCAKQSYDTSQKWCCDGVINKKYLSDRTDCCAKLSFDNLQSMCCDNIVFFNVAKRPTLSPDCCGPNSFSGAWQKCCPGNIVKNKTETC
jgi:hypothetical protein